MSLVVKTFRRRKESATYIENYFERDVGVGVILGDGRGAWGLAALGFLTVYFFSRKVGGDVT